jgi:hypothetical protein
VCLNLISLSAVLFFNNHFYCIVLHNNELYALVTDDGFRMSMRRGGGVRVLISTYAGAQTAVVWERLSTITGGRSHFYDDHFK